MTDSQGGAAPQCPRRPTTHERHGVQRQDDYAWLRDTADPRVGQYLRDERAHYDRVTRHLTSLRRELSVELTGRTPKQETSVGWPQAGAEWYLSIDATQEYERLVRVDPRTGAESTVLDLNALGRPGGFVDLGLCVPSPDGRLLAYSVDLTGDEIFELRFRDLSTGRDLPDVVLRSYYGGAWSADSGCFFYVVHDDAYRPDQVMRHRLGTGPGGDVLVHHEADPRFELHLRGSRDGGWVMIRAASRDTAEVRLVSTHEPAETPRVVAARRTGVDYDVEPLPGGWSGKGSAEDDVLLLVTNDSREEFGLMLAPVPAPGAIGDSSEWAPLATARVPEAALSGAELQDGERLESAAAFTGHVVLSLRGGGAPLLRVLPRAEGRTDDPIPPDGTPSVAAVFDIRPTVACGQVALWRCDDWEATSIVVVEENLVSPRRWSRIDLSTTTSELLRQVEAPSVDLSRYVTTRLWAASADGTQVPVTIAYRDDVAPGATSGALLYGYGAYEACSWPEFEVGTLSLLDRGVVFAVAHVRGGGEMGRRWWQGGRLRQKQHTFDDFIAARDLLVSAGWAADDAVASRGLSAGGLLQGAVFSQSPDRWRAVVAEVPFVDVVTTMSDPAIPLTVNEWDEWGDPVHDPGDFAAMLAYSPYDNPPPPDRPALLVTGAMHDPRVLVHEPAKWVARLRATDDTARPSPLLLRVELGEGAHTGPSGRFAHLHYEAEILAWILDQLGAVRPR